MGLRGECPECGLPGEPTDPDEDDFDVWFSEPAPDKPMFCTRCRTIWQPSD